MDRSPQVLRTDARTLKEQRPGLRTRDIAQALGVPEGGLIASACGDTAVRLDRDLPAQFTALESLGEVMALTRNEHAVIEKIGVYKNFSDHGHASQVLGDEVDLRLFLTRFHVGFAVTEPGTTGDHHSIQYFDEFGDATHKVHLRARSDQAAWGAFVSRFRAADQSPVQAFSPRAETAAKTARPSKETKEIDVDGLRTAYGRMQDTHELFGILRSFGVTRHQMLHLIGPEYARQVDRLALRPLLHAAAESALPIMIFVGSRGAIQIHTGPVRTLRQYGDWFNVMDPGFNLHLRETGIADAWVVKKPTADGLVSSLELYDAGGESMLLAFSKRKPGQVESEDWRTLLALLPAPGGAQ